MEVITDEETALGHGYYDDGAQPGTVRLNNDPLLEHASHFFLSSLIVGLRESEGPLMTEHTRRRFYVMLHDNSAKQENQFPANHL